MSRICTLVVLLVTAAVAAAQVQIHELGRDVITARLSHFAKNKAERQAMLRGLFEQAGCPQISEQPVKHASVPNLICTVPGEMDSVIIVGAHFDSVDDGDGVVDNWSGASLLPSLMESLKSRPRRHTFVFVGFTDEELGMVGSEYYANHLTKEERARVHAMVNLDTIGLSSTKVWLNHADKNLVQMTLQVGGALKMPIAAVNFEQVGATDSVPFESRKIPSLTLHSVMQQNHHILHSPDDKLKSINLDDYFSTYRLAAVLLAFMDTKLPLEAGKNK